MALTTRLMIAGAFASAAGIVVAVAGQGTAGGVLTLAGWLTLLASIHRFGRAG